MTGNITRELEDLVHANRILAHEGVVDGYGHVSFRDPRNPERYFMSCSRSPELVTLEDVMEYDLESRPIDQRERSMYIERPIHGAIYQARPDVHAVVHNHAVELLPFSVTNTPLRPILHAASGIGSVIPCWDIRDAFGDTDMLVTSTEQGHDLARTLGPHRVALMRGHGCVVAGATLREAVMISIYLGVNAKQLSEASRLGEVRYLTDGEIEKTFARLSGPGPLGRIWDYWVERCRG